MPIAASPPLLINGNSDPWLLNTPSGVVHLRSGVLRAHEPSDYLTKTVRLPRQIPYPAAMELLLCADRLSAHRVHEMGLLNEVCPPERLGERAEDYARRITANGPLAVRKTKESVLRGLAVDMREAYKIESAISSEVFASEDAVEGPKAFAEKRTPEWKNR